MIKLLPLLIILCSCDYSLDNPITQKELLQRIDNNIRCNKLTKNAHKINVQSCMIKENKDRDYCEKKVSKLRLKEKFAEECSTSSQSPTSSSTGSKKPIRSSI